MIDSRSCVAIPCILTSPTRLVVAPLDADCVPDIAVVHQQGEVTILLSQP